MSSNNPQAALLEASKWVLAYFDAGTGSDGAFERLRAAIAQAEAAPAPDERCDIDGLRYKLPPLVMTGHQLRQALQFVQADGSPESLDTEVCLALRPGGLDTEGEKVEAGLCIWLAEYPEEGSLLLDGKPLHDVPAEAAPKQEAVAEKWEGAEEWEPLAWALCADECGEDACEELVWEGGPIPEPWGARWLKYEGEAKRLIALVREHVPASQPQQPAPEPKKETP